MTGQYTVSTSLVIAGWYVAPDDRDLSHVDVLNGDIFLRRLPCNMIWPAPPNGLGNGKPCGFTFNFHPHLVDLIPTDGLIRVIGPDGQALINAGAITRLGKAADGGQKLRSQLEKGWIVDKWGSLKLPFRASPGLDQKFFDFYSDISAAIKQQLGVELFLCYGSLLGCIRDQKLIPFDDDIDASYVSRYTEIADVAREFYELRTRLKAMSTSVELAISVVETGQAAVITHGDLHFDIFTSWIDKQQRYNCYFGVTGDLGQDTLPLKTIRFMGHDALIPADPERVLKWTYGPGWKVPDPHFKWVPSPEVELIMNELREQGRQFAS